LFTVKYGELDVRGEIAIQIDSSYSYTQETIMSNVATLCEIKLSTNLSDG